MGVRQHNLILIGYDIGSQYYNDDEWGKEDSLYKKYDLSRKSKSGDIVILNDCYSDKYFIIGKLIRVDYDCEGNGLGIFTLENESDEFKQGKEEVQTFINDVYGLNVEPTYVVMTHHT